MGTLLSYKRPDGKNANGYFAPAGAAHAPGIVVIQEWWGLQEQIRGVVDRFALAGYNAIAPDLYEGIVVPYHDRDTAGHQITRSTSSTLPTRRCVARRNFWRHRA